MPSEIYSLIETPPVRPNHIQDNSIYGLVPDTQQQNGDIQEIEELADLLSNRAQAKPHQRIQPVDSAIRPAVPLPNNIRPVTISNPANGTENNPVPERSFLSKRIDRIAEFQPSPLAPEAKALDAQIIQLRTTLENLKAGENAKLRAYTQSKIDLDIALTEGRRHDVQRLQQEVYRTYTELGVDIRGRMKLEQKIRESEAKLIPIRESVDLVEELARVDALTTAQGNLTRVMQLNANQGALAPLDSGAKQEIAGYVNFAATLDMDSMNAKELEALALGAEMILGRIKKPPQFLKEMIRLRDQTSRDIANITGLDQEIYQFKVLFDEITSRHHYSQMHSFVEACINLNTKARNIRNRTSNSGVNITNRQNGPINNNQNTGGSGGPTTSNQNNRPVNTRPADVHFNKFAKQKKPRDNSGRYTKKRKPSPRN